LNNECGENLYEVGKNKFDNFVDLLMYIEENSKINSRQILTLIKIKFFDEFGKNKKLLNIYNEFSSGKNKYDKKLKQETKNKRIGHLIKFENNETNEEMSIWEQIAFEQESLGYIQATYNLDKKYVYIQKLNEKFSPLIECYSLATGNTVTLKIQKKLFKNKNFLAGDVIFCKRFTKKPSVKFSDGKFIEIEGEFTWWLEDYDIIEQDKIDKLVKGKI
jgi:DNA polymerase-3 subunit alpha